MQIVLVVAAVVSVLIGEYGTAIGLAVLTLFNAWLGYHQEGKAEAAAAALGAMMKAVAKVRRDGEVIEVPADEIVPGDIVVVDAGRPGPGRRPGDRRGDPAGRGGRPDRRERRGREEHRGHRHGPTCRSATAPTWRS